MAATIRKGSPWRDHRVWDAGIPRGAARFRATRTTRSSGMTWQTPQACDFRFGFEITMYIAAR